jgi:hypothetical protein
MAEPRTHVERRNRVAHRGEQVTEQDARASRRRLPVLLQGTALSREIADNPDGDGTRLVMSHAGWEPDNPVIGRVTQGWGEILTRLRGYAENGTPQPYFEA